MIKKFTFAALVMILAAGTAAQVNAQTVGYAPIVRDLAVGSRGADVASLQAFLEGKGYISIPAGVARGYFGPLTQYGVSRFQAERGIYPPSGYFGLQTRQAYNTEIGGGSAGGTSQCPPGFVPAVYSGFNVCVPGSSNNGGNTSGKASLDNFTVSEGDDTELGEGDEDAEVMEIEFDVEDGDVTLESVEIFFEFVGGSDADDEPWEVFDRARLIADGDEIGDIDLDDEDEWSDEGSDTYGFVLDNLDDYDIDEDDTAELVLELDVASSVDGADEGDASWDIYIPDDGIVVKDESNATLKIGDDSENVTVDIDEDGDDDDDDNNGDEILTISESNDDPSSKIFNVDDNDASDWETIFVFELEADDTDVDLIELPMTLAFLGSSTFGNPGSFNDVIEELEIEIDGDDFDDFDVLSPNSDKSTVIFMFDSGDVTIDDGDTVTVEVRARFKEADDNYEDDSRIWAYVTSTDASDIIADDEDGDEIDTDDITGTASGSVHTLSVN